MQAAWEVINNLLHASLNLKTAVLERDHTKAVFGFTCIALCNELTSKSFLNLTNVEKARAALCFCPWKVISIDRPVSLGGK